MATVIDERAADAPEPWGYVVFHDTALSGWGGAEHGRSLYALAVSDRDEADTVLAAGRRRTDMRSGRMVRNIHRLQLHRGDHLTIVDRSIAARWYEPHGFAELDDARAVGD